MTGRAVGTGCEDQDRGAAGAVAEPTRGGVPGITAGGGVSRPVQAAGGQGGAQGTPRLPLRPPGLGPVARPLGLTGTLGSCSSSPGGKGTLEVGPKSLGGQALRLSVPTPLSV